MKFLRLLCLLPALVILLATCKEAGVPTDANGNPTGNVTTTLAGIVVDESGQPVPSAAVIANGKNAVTDKYGTFMIQNAVVPGNRCVILCKKNGYFTGSRAEVPKGGGITELRLTLQSSAPGYTVNSSTGGTLTIGTASVKFPPSAFVTSDGSPFTGSVKVAAKHLDPSNASFYNSFSGDMTARRTDGTQTELLSYGVLRVRLTDETGNELKLATGKTATLTYPIAASQQKTAPSSMPLWYFDEAIGMWKEEGVATKSGDVYSGEVSHFTDWNCDNPAKTGIVKGRVMCKSEGTERIYVTVGQRRTPTDSNGYFSCKVPINTDMVVSVNPAENYGFTAPEIAVSALNEKEERTVTVQLSSCPSQIVGTLTDCDGLPIAGIIVVLMPNGLQFQCTTTGDFKICVPSETPLNVTAAAYNGIIVFPFSVGTLKSGEVKNLGQIVCCRDGGRITFTDINFGQNNLTDMILSPDGSMVVVSGYRYSTSSRFSEVYETNSGRKLCSLVYGAFNFSDDGKKLLTGGDINTMVVVDPHTGKEIQNFKATYGRILPDGSAIIARDSMNMYSMYSVQDGTKIKDFSFQKVDDLTLVGTHGSDKLVLFSESTMRIVHWDIATDQPIYDMYIGNAAVPSFPAYSYRRIDRLFDANFSVVGFIDKSYGRDLYFYMTQNGAKINPKPFALGILYGNWSRYVLQDFTIADNESFAVQRMDEKDNFKIMPPEIYSLPDLQLRKVLPMASANDYLHLMMYSANSQYLAAVVNNNTYGNSDHTVFVRTWKVK